MSELDEIMYQIKVYDDEYNKNILDEWRMSLDNGNHYGKATQVYDFTKHRYIVEYVSDNYDIHTEIQTLLQENKQLKEDKKKAIEWVKKNQYYFPKPTELLKILGDKE